MRSPFAASTRRAGQRAFSLVELLVVLAIVGILAAIAIPSIGPMVSSYNLNRGGGMVMDELSFARQAALTRNADVEVRFYRTGSNTKASDLQFRAFRTFLANTTTPSQAVALDKISYLPGQIILFAASDPKSTSPSTTFSPLLDSATYDASPYPTSSSSALLTTGTDTLPNGTSANYVGFLFRATGGTNLPIPSTGSVPIGLWYVTVCQENAPVVSSTGAPNNYVTVQVDPVDGQVRTYRP